MFVQETIDYRDSEQEFEAVIYVRVSDPKQTRDGSGRESQVSRGKEYAKYLGIPVAKVIYEKEMSGKFLDRPGVQEMMGFLRRPEAGTQYVVIIDDISRLARDVRVFFDLRDALEDVGAFLESPTTKFKQVRDAEGNHYEGMQALNAQFWREKNAETTRNRKWARLKDGYWPYKSPLGYKFQRVKGQGNLLVRDEPQASILTEAFEGYASGHFASQGEVKRFLENHPDFAGKLPDGSVNYQRIVDLMTNPIYAGFVQCAKLGIPLSEGRHEPLISFATFKKMEERRKGLAVAPARKDLHLDFPLRGFVTCGDCEKPLRAGWSKGKRKRYAYYNCQTKGCDSYGKSIRRDDVEGGFVALLKDMRPAAPLFAMVRAMVLDAWNQRSAQADLVRKSMRRDALKIDRQIDGFLEKIVEATSATVVKAYERKIEQLERDRLLAAEKSEKSFKPTVSAEELLEHPLRFLANPCKLWESGETALQKLVLRLAFSEPLPYHRIEGYRTPKMTLPFSMLGGNMTPKEVMVPLG